MTVTRGAAKVRSAPAKTATKLFELSKFSGKGVIQMDHSQSWPEIIEPWIMMFIAFTVILFINVVLATLVGIAVGWLFSLIFIGDWINEGLKAVGVSIIPGSLYKIGAVAGFLSGFFKYSFSFKR